MKNIISSNTKFYFRSKCYTFIQETSEIDLIEGIESLVWIVFIAENEWSDAYLETKFFNEKDAYVYGCKLHEKYRTLDLVN